MKKNYYPFASMPTVAQLDSRGRRAIYCEENGYMKRAAEHWYMVFAGEQMRLDAGLDIYREDESVTGVTKENDND